MKQFHLFKKIFSEHPEDNNHTIAPYDMFTTMQDRFTRYLGQYSHFDEHMFQMGWFNHQLSAGG